MNLETFQAILAIIKEVRLIIDALHQMGIRVDGTLKLDEVVALLRRNNAG